MNYSKDNNNKRRKANRSNKRKVRNKAGMLLTRVLVAAVLIAGFATGGAAIGAYLGILENAPKVDVKIQPNIYTSVIYFDDGQESDRLKAEENREYVNFDVIPQDMKDAFVAIEDERFYEHNGVDLRGMLRAVVTNLTTDRREGASTITQQLIKNNVRKMSKNTLTSKLQEQYLAVEFEKNLVAQYGGDKKKAKDHILEVYLNSINMHYSLNGVQTASEYYFERPVSELTLSECAVLAAITQNPARNAPIANPDRNKARRKLILDKMLELGMITQGEYDEAIDDPVYDRVSTQTKVIDENNSVHSYFVDALMNAVVDDLQEEYNIGVTEAFNWIYNHGLKIYSTQNKHMQEIMDDSFKDDSLFPAKDFKIDVQYTVSIKNSVTDKTEHFYETRTVKSEEELAPLLESFRNELLGENDSIVAEKYIPIPQPQAAMVIEDFETGQVKAMAGGRGEKMANLALNRATDSERQPGSVFKVLASYAPALDLGVITPTTVLDDAPYEYKGYSPTNWYGGYRGRATVRDGIRNSMNVITVKNMVNTGIEECYKYLKNFGFTTLVDGETINGEYFTDIGPATCLGGLTRGVTQIELTAAYGAIASMGEYYEPVLYTKVLDHDGNVILENKPEPRRVLKEQVAYQLTDMMQDVIKSGTGGKARFKNINMPLAGKTGTTTETKDLMFVGYTPYYVSSIWLGYDTPETIKQDTGYHMLLWSDVMEKIHAELPYKTFSGPENVAMVSICKVSGKLAISGLCDRDHRGSMTRTDWVPIGTQPTEYCDMHVSASVDTSTGMKAGPYCPSEYIKYVVGIVGQMPYDGEDAQYSSQACNVHTAESVVGNNAYYVDPEDGTVHVLPKPDFGMGTDDPLIEDGAQTPKASANPTDAGSEGWLMTPGGTPTPTPVPEYVAPSPYPQELPSTVEPSFSWPQSPVIDEPQSMDNFYW